MDGRLIDPTSPYYDKLLLPEFKKRFVSAGAAFVRHYTNSPQCVPSRTSMLTGRYCSDVGTTNNGQGLARSTRTGALDTGCVGLWGAAQCKAFAARQAVNQTFLDLAAAAGHAVHMVGRVDAGGGILDDYPGTTGNGFHSGPDLHILARGADIAGTTDVEPWSSTRPNAPNPYAPDENEDGVLEQWLRTHHQPAGGKWLAWLGLLDPHPPYASNATWRALVNASAVDAPPLPAWADMHPFDARQSLLKNVVLEYTPEQLKTMRETYWGACAQALSGLVNVLDVAANTGHLNNTVVIFTADHGEMSMEHRQDYKNSAYEASSRVPLLIVPFGVPAMAGAAGRIVNVVTSHVDILPTIVDLVSGGAAAPPAGLRGQSLVPYLLAAPPPPRAKDFAYVEFHSNLASTGQYALVQSRYKLVQYGHTWPWFNASAYTPRLFDVEADPQELNDLAAEQPAVVAAMTAALEAELGGSGAIARVDREIMDENLALYRSFFQAVYNDSQLLKMFANAYVGPSPAELSAAVGAWSGHPIL